jgi:hypothetical protein
MLLPLAAIAICLLGLISSLANAQAWSPKLAPDLVQAMTAAKLPVVGWAQSSGNTRNFKVLICTVSTDPALHASQQRMLHHFHIQHRESRHLDLRTTTAKDLKEFQ